MPIQISIVGLGQIGASIGLALAGQNDLRRIGHDINPDTMRKAEKLGAVDKTSFNLPNAVREADLIVLALPIDQIRPTMEVICAEMKENSVLVDTAPLKEVVATWAGELLPAERYYVGLVPVINPAYLFDAASGIDAAHADLFHDGLLAITTPPRTPSEAIQLASDLASLLGTNPFFVDPQEVDGLMAATHLLPMLLAATLMNTNTEQPGWRESRKVAGRAYAAATAPILQLDSPAALKSAVLLNRENVLRMLDFTATALETIRSRIVEQDAKALEGLLTQARKNRELWWKERQSSDWSSDGQFVSAAQAPKVSDIFGRWLSLGRKDKK